MLPESRLTIIGRNPGKLAYFSFAERTFISDELPEDFQVDHGFECCGGEGSYYAFDDMIQYLNPQGTIVMMGVSENRIPINTRDVLERESQCWDAADLEELILNLQQSVWHSLNFKKG